MVPNKRVYDNKVAYYNLMGNYHREDGPAVIWNNGTQEWYKHGLRHRIGGPATIHSNGYTSWYVNGKRHRLDGPAVEWTTGSVSWYINGVWLTDAIDAWLIENNIDTNYHHWTLGNHLQFKLAWG